MKDKEIIAKQDELIEYYQIKLSHLGKPEKERDLLSELAQLKAEVEKDVKVYNSWDLAKWNKELYRFSCNEGLSDCNLSPIDCVVLIDWFKSMLQKSTLKEAEKEVTDADIDRAAGKEYPYSDYEWNKTTELRKAYFQGAVAHRDNLIKKG